MSEIINYKNKLLIFLVLILTSGFMLTSLVSYFVSRTSLRGQIDSGLPLTSDNIYSEIQRDLLKPIFISSLMSNDTFLKDWVINGEKDIDEISKYLKNINDKYNVFTSFFVSDASSTYYQSEGILKKINPDEERDKWYYRVKNMVNEYEINVDPDLANDDMMTIFINYKMFGYENDFIGATGVGLSINTVKSIVKRYKNKFNRDVYFADKKGDIIISSKEFSGNIKNINDIKEIGPHLKNITESEDYTSSYELDGNTVHLNTRYIPEMRWYIFVEQQEHFELADIFNTLVLNLIISVIILIVVIWFIVLGFDKYHYKLDELSLIDVEQKKKLKSNNTELKKALEDVKQLSGFLPICANCKNIRDDKGYWKKLEEYISSHSEAKFSHNICPDCKEKLYKDI